jgi:hypothetical protein
MWLELPIAFCELMRLSFMRVILWSSRLLSVAIALWWPGLWRDPIYTPRHARLTGQELRLPGEAEPAIGDDRALAIFWMWEHRTLVTTHWVIGPYRGLRDAQGRMQTLLAMTVVWGVGSGVLLLRARLAPASSAERPRGKGVLALLAMPLWKFLTCSRKDQVPQ